MIAQAQFINSVLETKDASLITLNNLNSDYFSDYPQEFNFIKAHLDSYGRVPDIETFVDKFPDFDIIHVTETSDYLLNAIFEDKAVREFANIYNKAGKLFNENKRMDAINYLKNAVENMQTSKHIHSTSLKDNVQRYDDYLKRCSDFGSYYVTTGLPELDELIGGWDRKEEYATIVARTNAGKSWLLMYFAQSAAKVGLRVGIYSGEMSVNKVGYRIDTLISHISNSGLTHGDNSIQAEYLNYIKNLNTTLKGDIRVITPNDVDGPCGVSALESFILKDNLDILFIDQHSLLEDDHKAKTPTERASNISKDIKLLQVKRHIPIITVSQQNRTKSDNGDVNTTMIAQSDRIGQDSTIVIFFENNNGTATLQLVKARDASNSKKLNYAWDINRGLFTYIPSADENATESDKEKCANLKKEFDECENDTEFK